MMQMHDTVDLLSSRFPDAAVIRADIPAYVFPNTSKLETDNSALVIATRLTAIIEPLDVDIEPKQAIRWRGQPYLIAERPALHMKHGQPHHVTIFLTQNEWI